jgi:asparagine synthase (glutamine-hydrolysing)
MCGITGIFHYRNSHQVDPSVLKTMRDSMAHRGPDGAGLWISADHKVGLAHRRLSIVDLTAAAAQPMSNEDGTIWVSFNGEIYNHKDLRKELLACEHSFRTDHSDTEVLVHGYEQWGIDGLATRLSGDYAICLWDARNRILSILRDRVGVKPLYFSLQNGTFLCASEIKAILEHPSVSREMDASAMYHYLSFLTTPAPMTMFQGIYKLPAGYYAQVRMDGDFTARRYWDAVPGQGIDPSETRGLSDQALEKFYVEGIRTRLEDAISERMMSDVPFGVFLSGGIDSSTNVALMSRLMDRPVDTFTVGFSDHTHLNEMDYARQIATKFGTNHHEVLINESDMVGYLKNLIHSQDEPLADWVCVPLYFVSKLAKDNGVTVIQVGEGSDEQFCGYGTYMTYLKLHRMCWRPFQALLPKFAQRGIAGLARSAAKRKSVLKVYADIVDRAARDRELFWSGATCYWENMKEQFVRKSSFRAKGIPEELLRTDMLPNGYLQQDSYRVIESFLGRFDGMFPGQDQLTRMIYNEFKLRLPELLLMRVDKITMSVSLEARVPFLAHKLVEFTMDIPMKWKVRNNTAKYLLKKAVEGIIPDNLIYRKKMGFGAPMEQWLKGKFGQETRSVLLQSRLIEQGYFDGDYIRTLFDNHISGHANNSLLIWSLFNLTSWYDYWIEGRAARAA